ncbi:MAG: DUF4123 domain-containing protein [Sulfurovum sp.]|nr:DUF4123 domain-containing protein [Sulfurovum sp.]
MKQIDTLSEKLYTLAQERNANLYAIADAGIYKELIDVFDIASPEHHILFKESWVREYENVAPYIVALNKEDETSQKLIAEGFGKTWLTFLISSHNISTLAFDLAERINVYSEKHDKEIIFRFYDPRNLERYFKMQTEAEVSELLGDLQGTFAYVDVEDPNKLNIFSTEQKECISLEGEVA